MRLLAPLGVMAAVALDVYATLLGTEGPVYRWLPQYGTVVHFGFTCLCLLLLGRAVLPRWHGHSVVAMAVALPLLGVGNAIVPAFFDDALKARVENVTEWWGSLIFVLGFFPIAAMWRRAGVALQFTRTPHH